MRRSAWLAAVVAPVVLAACQDNRDKGRKSVMDEPGHSTSTLGSKDERPTGFNEPGSRSTEGTSPGRAENAPPEGVVTPPRPNEGAGRVANKPPEGKPPIAAKPSEGSERKPDYQSSETFQVKPAVSDDSFYEQSKADIDRVAQDVDRIAQRAKRSAKKELAVKADELQAKMVSLRSQLQEIRGPTDKLSKEVKERLNKALAEVRAAKDEVEARVEETTGTTNPTP